ncbi:MAG: MBL fold metallo-hydrolase RNA specificity domain-containing protein, partial [Candidatus Acidiferrum sp.]
DLGRRGLPFLPEPSAVPAADLLICESTYGGRLHETLDRMAEKLAAIMRSTAARGGKVLIPAFSLGRTQLVVYFIQRWMSEGLLPRLPIFIDSPLAAQIAAVYDRYGTSLQVGSTASFPEVHYLQNRDEAQSVSMRPQPCVIVASGGMCEGGRIMHHLRHHIDDPRSAIVLVSYQAPHTIGRQLLERRPSIRFHGKKWNKWAEVVELNGFSGHADRDDFIALLGPVAKHTGRVRLVHGEPEQAEALAQTLRSHGFRDVCVAFRQECVSVA